MKKHQLKKPPLTTRFDGLESRSYFAAHIVGSSTVYTTIQSAVDAAMSGAVINVDAGTYTETVTINKKLTLDGAKYGVDARSRTGSETIVTGATVSNVKNASFIIAASGVTIDGFTVQGETSQSVATGAGIVIKPNMSGTHLFNNIIQNNVAGVYLANNSTTDAAVIQHNLFTSNNNAGANGGRGIYTDTPIAGTTLTNVTIDANTFTNNHGGSGTTGLEAAAAFEGSAGKQSNIRITNNTFTNNGKSVLFFNTTGVLLQGNTASGASDWYSGSFRFEGNNQNVTIQYNNIINNPGPGVAIDSNGVPGNNSGFVITNNNIYGNGTNYSSRLGVVSNNTVYTGVLDVRNNYWGSASGPSGDGPGTGNAVYGIASKATAWSYSTGGTELFSPWSTSLINIITTIPPTAPSGLTASVVSSSQINLAWANNSTDQTSVTLQRSTDNSTFTTVGTFAGSTNSYNDTGLASGTTYYYRVFASTSAGPSANSSVASASTLAANATVVNLSDLNWSSATTGYGAVMKDMSVNGNPITLNGVTYAKGIGTHAVSNIVYNLAGQYSSFIADVGVDDEVDSKGIGSVIFRVYGDGTLLFDSGVVNNTGTAAHLNVSVAGVNTLTLVATNGVANSIDYDHADWAGAQLIGTPTAPIAPSGLAATALSSSSIKLNWTTNSSNQTSFAIDRSTDGTNFVNVATNVAPTATTWTDPATLAAGTTYYYRVRAVNAVGSSPASNIASAATLSSSLISTNLSALNWTSATTGYGAVQKNSTVNGNAIKLRGTTYASGIGAHAVSNITYNLAGQYTTFLSDVGVDDEVGTTSGAAVRFQVYGDGTLLYDSGVLTRNSGVASVSVSVSGVQTLTLVVTNGVPGIDYDHADWAGARLLSSPAAPLAPTSVAALGLSSSSIKVTWSSGGGAAATGYKIDRSLDGTTWTTQATVGASVLTYTDTGLAANTLYSYRVRATNAVGDSSNSATASARTLSATAVTTNLSSLNLNWTSATTGYGTVQKDVSVRGNPLMLGGTTYTTGIGTHAASTITYNLGGAYKNFLSDVGVDDEENGIGTGSVVFQVIGDGRVLYTSGTLNNGAAPASLNVDVTGVQTLTLVATNAIPNDIDYDHADWAGARLLS